MNSGPLDRELKVTTTNLPPHFFTSDLSVTKTVSKDGDMGTY